MRKLCLLMGASCAFVTASANAATVSELITFSADTFQAYTYPGYIPAATPEDPVTGSFVMTFDPTETYNDSTDITLNSLNITLSSTLVFSYSPSSSGSFDAGTLRIGGIAGATATQNGSDVVTYAPSDNDFWLFIKTFDGSPTFDQVGYAQTATNGNLYYTLSNTGSVSATPYVPGAVPEPSTWTMMGLGFAGLAHLGWRRANRSPRALAST